MHSIVESKYHKVEAHPELVRDVTSQALINVDKTAITEHRLRRRNQSKINNLEREVAELKDMVRALLEIKK
jgi:hypothetical protein